LQQKYGVFTASNDTISDTSHQFRASQPPCKTFRLPKRDVMKFDNHQCFGEPAGCTFYRYFLSHTACCWRSVYCLATGFDLAYQPSSGRLYTNRNINRNCIVR